MIKLVFIFHGYGSNGSDLSVVSNSMKVNFPDIIILTPDAPFPCNQEENSFQWFSIDVLDPVFFRNGLDAVEPIVVKYIESEIKQHNIKNYEEVVLCGFSQGAALAMHLGLRSKNKFGGIISISGGLSDSIKTLEENIQSKPEILLIHGDKDNVLPLAYSLKTKKTLDHFNIKNHLHIIENLGHKINQKSIDHINHFISNINNGI